MNNEASVILIDYGMATSFLDKNGNHLKKDQVDTFKGNILFASLSALEFNQPSRKDDLISLCYLMLYLLNDGDFPYFAEYAEEENKFSNVVAIRDIKRKYSLLKMTDSVGLEAEIKKKVIMFVNEIEGLKYD